jgi:hypothetical protein
MKAPEAERVILISLYLAPVPKERAVSSAFQAEFALILHEFHCYLLWLLPQAVELNSYSG